MSSAEVRVAGALSAEVEAVRRGLEASERSLAPIILVTDDIRGTVDAAESALLALPRVTLFQRAGQIVRVVKAPANLPRRLAQPMPAPIIEAIPADALREELAAAADWRGPDGKPTKPPRWVSDTLAARGCWRLPVLAGIAEHPVLRPDGSLFEHHGAPARGYDEEGTGLFVHLAPEIDGLSIPDRPTRDDAQAALGVLGRPLADFPFQNESSRAAALAAVLTLLARHLIPGPVPCFAVRAPEAGTGKTLLADAVNIIASGKFLARMAPGNGPEEDRKRLLSVALAGLPAVLLDNIEGQLGSAPLAAALTAGEITDRALGGNRIVTAPWRAVLFATGNALSFRGDLRRRVVPIDLDARCEVPEERGGFEFPDLLGHVQAERRAYVSAALTALRAFLLERPRVDLPAMGSFEAWSSIVRACAVWCGLPDPCGGREALRHEADPEREQLGALLAAWQDTFGNEPATCREALDRSEHNRALADALPESHGRPATAKSLGHYLRRNRSRIVDGFAFEPGGLEGHAKVQTWRALNAGNAGNAGNDLSGGNLGKKERAEIIPRNPCIPATEIATNEP